MKLDDELKQTMEMLMQAQKVKGMLAVYQTAFNNIAKEMSEFERLKGISADRNRINLDKFMTKTKNTLNIATEILEKM